MNRYLRPFFNSLCLAMLAICIAPARALDWSDTSVSWRYGSNFAEPFNNKAISKHTGPAGNGA